MKTISCLRTNYRQNGYVIIKKAFSERICGKLIEEVQKLKTISGFLSNPSQDPNAHTHLSSKFFVDEFNRVSHFFQNTYSKDQSLDRQSIIKIGHALHTNKLFGQVTFGKSIQQAHKQLGITESVVLQSMILQKLPRKGGKVTMHQDSTYLFSEPDTVNGYWMPLQDTTKENGCIWLIPGSHRKKLFYKFRVVNGIPSYDFEGPIDYKEQESIPIQMERGDLLIFHGRIIHKSDENASRTSRYAYTWHTMEKTSRWSEENWLSFEEIKKYQKLQNLII